MRIAIVNQAIDRIVPPNQNSVGVCTLGVARPLARYAKVLIYGLKDNHPGDCTHGYEMEFRLIPSTASDRTLVSAQKKSAKLFRRSTPLSTSRWLYPGYGRQVALDLKQQQCDVIHLQHCSQYAPVIRAHNPIAKIVLHLHAEWFSQTNHAMLAHRLRSVDLLTTVGGYVTEKTKRAFPFFADRCETTYNGVDVQEFLHEKDYRAGRNRAVKHILYSGAISPHKGLHILFEAFVKVARQCPDVHLDIVGPIGNYPIEENFDLKDVKTIKEVAPYYSTSRVSLVKRRLARNQTPNSFYLDRLKASLPVDVCNRVSIWGMIPRQELLARYYSSDIFVFPSIWDEGFGLPPVEAMAAGLPVVATRSGTVVETLLDGETGFLVEKNNVDQLAHALLFLVKNDDSREAMGRAGRHRVLQYFTWDRVAAKMYARYRELCHSRSVGDQMPFEVPMPSRAVRGQETSTPQTASHRGH
jgi:glycosyltransferase involved in cell wall biosynthesis